MTKQVRDWQEDIKLVEAYKHAQTLHNIPYPRKLSWENNLPEPTELILEYWLKQYAAEKKRADAWERSYYALQANMPNMSRCMRMITHSLKPQNPGKRNFGKKWNG